MKRRKEKIESEGSGKEVGGLGLCPNLKGES